MSGTDARGPGRGATRGEEFRTWAARTSRGGKGRARAEEANARRGKRGAGAGVLMSYVCDAETPKLAHAIVYVYVYPL